ncbi:MAG: pseudoazurin [Alphaproteobacteria bacterium]|nr:pseudoazurin [Alphaproteobacteria bacterium]
MTWVASSGGRSLLALAAGLLIAAPAAAKDIVVHMKNKGAGGVMVFEPAFVRAQVGDTVRFVPTDKSHNAETIPGMLPPGAASFKGKINEAIAYKITKPGVYGVKCQPHASMGMVALVQAGAPTNLAAAKSAPLPGLAKKRMDGLLAQVK